MKRLICFLALLLTGITVIAQDISSELLGQIETIESFVTDARGLETLEPVDRRFPARADAIEQVRAIYAAEIPPEEAERLNHFYIAFDFLPPGSDYVSLYLDALAAQIGGFYDPLTKEMNTLLLSGGTPGDKLPLLEQIIYAHEFAHALQDQHFDLTAIDEQTRANRDQAMAVLALIEGDATLVMNLYTQEISSRNPLGTALQLLAQGFTTNTLFLPPGLPDIIASELLSAYTDGAVFASVIQARGGWEAVNAAFQPENWPQSTEQILHPEKYLNGEAPLPVTLHDVTLEPAWEIVWDTTFGEFYLREYLKTQLSNRAAALAAAGWGGDHYRIYRHTETGELAWVMRIEWDTARDAAEFADAYSDFLARRFADGVEQESCWSTAAESLCFTGDTVSHLIAYAPTLALAQQLLAGQN
ncbi:MAG TPA: hypothetical protein VKY59_20585 [Spirillospora sp.]|nr:hypothetical protein [Spirillospora sp.]